MAQQQKTKLRRRQTYSDSGSNAMLKDEEANLELMRSPNVPEELQSFLKEIAYPVAKEEEDNDSGYQTMKANVKGAKSRVKTGSFKGRRRKNKPDEETAVAEEEDQEDEEDVPEAVVKRRGDAKFSEYEMAVLWSQYKDKFPGGKMNNIQLTQMLRQVFPRCGQEQLQQVVKNIRHIFDPQETGTISFRDLLITFSLSMKGSLKDRLKWSFRLYDEEGDGKIDRDDLVQTITRLCEFTKNAQVYWKCGGGRRVEDEPPKVEEQLVSKSGGKKPGKGSENNKAVQLKKKQVQQPPPSQEEVIIPVTEEKVKYVASLDEEEKKRAIEVVRYLDANGDGWVTQEEFVQGCLDDEEFFGIASCFQGELIWGDLL